MGGGFTLLGRFAALAGLFIGGAAAAQGQGDSGPRIELWYGADQYFGLPASPVRFVNILGRISPENAAAEYSLNGGSPVKLKLGPDSRRLEKPGDFNVELETAVLKTGENTVVITARDRVGSQSGRTVRLHYTPGKTPGLPFFIHWNAAARIDSAAQILDGLWKLAPEGVRTGETGYDRLIALGDIYWNDYEITSRVIIHSFDTSVNGVYPSYHCAAGFVLRWHGHLDWDGTRPRWGYAPAGAIAWYSYIPDLKAYRLTFMGGPDRNVRFFGTDPTARQLEMGIPYIFKVRVQSQRGRPSMYRMKVWRAGGPEPSRWDLQAEGMPGELTQGSILLIGHHADVTFGDVTVTPLPPE
ncbi:MAG: hypothetical protein U0Q18_13075 [Bryobacteraceae bacterium]